MQLHHWQPASEPRCVLACLYVAKHSQVTTDIDDRVVDAVLQQDANAVLQDRTFCDSPEINHKGGLGGRQTIAVPFNACHGEPAAEQCINRSRIGDTCRRSREVMQAP